MTDQHRQGYPERDPYRPDPQSQQGPRPYGGQPGPQPHDDRYRDQEMREEYGERYDHEDERRKGGAAKWVVIILLAVAALIAAFLWLNRDEDETADPLPEQSTTQAADEAGEAPEGNGETKVIGDAILPVVVQEWKLNTLVVPTYMRGLDAVAVVEGDAAPDDLISKIGDVMSETQNVSFGKCGVFDFEQLENVEFLEKLGASPQACTLQVGETELLVVSIKGAEMSDLVTIADSIDQS